MEHEIDGKTRAWLNEAAARSKGNIENCEMYAGVVTKSFIEDPLCALQLGYALLLDKPIVLIVDKNVQIPASLVRASKLIERVDFDDPDWASKATGAISTYIKDMK
jgi:hypothetical protein